MSPPPIPRLSFGLVITPSSELVAPFVELADWMRANAALDLTSRPAESYKALAASVREGSSDVAWLPPVAYAWLAEAVTPIGSLVRAGTTSYAATLVVRHDSELRTLEDLRGVRAGWVDPWSAAGYVVPRLELARAGINPARAFSAESFHGSHRDALLALERGECDVVGTYARLPHEDVGPHGRVRVLATLGAIPADVIAVRRNLGPREYTLVAQAFRAACEDAAARSLVRAVFDAEELREGSDPAHDALRLAYERGVATGLFD